VSLKECNEITVKIKGTLEEFYKIVEEKGFKIIDKFSMNDAYFIPVNLNIDSMSTREILTKAVLVRDIRYKISSKIIKKITFKIKDFDKGGNILNQEAVNCDVLEIEDAKKLLVALDYKPIMIIKENDIVYEKDGFQLAVKDIENGDKLIEIEIEENKKLGSIEKLKQKVNEIEIPIYTDNYFVKKAEIELDKVLKR
jgi:adenylate cyclase class IV